MTASGVQWFNRPPVTWLDTAIANIVVAALIDAAVFKLRDGSSGPLGVLEGLVMVMLAILALALKMRLFVRT